MYDAIRNRYGFTYVPVPQVRLPEPTPLYGMPEPNAQDVVLEHGDWCLRNMVGKDAAARLPIPQESIPIFASHEAEVLRIMDERRKLLSHN